jgi:hypothetical protein
MAPVPLHHHDVFPPDRKLTKADIKRGAAQRRRRSRPAQHVLARQPKHIRRLFQLCVAHLRGGFSPFRVLTRRNEFERSCEMECATLENSPCREPLLS